MTASLLLIDDEAAVANAIKRCLSRDGYSIATADCGARALELFAERPYDLVICDLALPDTDGLTVLGRLAECAPRTVRLLATGSGAEAGAPHPTVEGLVYRLVAKPWDDLDLRLTVRRALEHQQLCDRVQALEAQLRQKHRPSGAALELPL